MSDPSPIPYLPADYDAARPEDLIRPPRSAPLSTPRAAVLDAETPLVSWPQVDPSAAPFIYIGQALTLVLWRSNAIYGIMRTHVQEAPRVLSTRRGDGRNLYRRCDMSSIPKAPGIYKITCFPTGKVYVGSATNLYQRYYDHLKTLRGNRHINPHLQRAWNKYGETSFVFSVIELIMFVEDLTTREQHWMDRLHATDARRGFNIAPTAGSTLGVVFSDSGRDNISAAKSKPITGFIAPDGTQVTIHNMRAFCREHGLKASAMYALVAGKQAQHRGWRHTTSYTEIGRGFKHEWEGFIDPDGNPVPPFRNLMLFCLLHGLHRPSMRKLALGNRRSHRGYTHINALAPLTYKTYYGFIAPDGTPIGPISNLGAFCEQHQLDHATMLHLVSGRKRSHRGWTYRSDREEQQK